MLVRGWKVMGLRQKYLHVCRLLRRTVTVWRRSVCGKRHRTRLVQIRRELRD